MFPRETLNRLIYFMKLCMHLRILKNYKEITLSGGNVFLRNTLYRFGTLIVCLMLLVSVNIICAIIHYIGFLLFNNGKLAPIVFSSHIFTYMHTKLCKIHLPCIIGNELRNNIRCFSD